MDRDEIVHILGGFALFADLSRPELDAITHTFDEEWFGKDQRILHQGFTGTGLYVILEGAASVRIDGQERARLSRGDFFGEISILLDEPPTADVVAVTPLRCLVLGRPEVPDWLISKPTVALRMLQAEARRLRMTNQWRS